MKIIDPSFEILNPVDVTSGIYMLKAIEYCGRISHRSEEKQHGDSWKRFIQAVVTEHGDWSIVEHQSATVVFRVDRGVTHELVRHRLFSFTQESTRFVRYSGEMEFIVPAPVERTEDPVFMELWTKAMNQAEENYGRALSQNWYPQVARSLLPNALAATIAVTGNLRNWRHIFLMRTSKETHPDFRRVMIPLLEEFKKRIPILYDDIEPNARQIDNLRKPR